MVFIVNLEDILTHFWRPMNNLLKFFVSPNLQNYVFLTHFWWYIIFTGKKNLRIGLLIYLWNLTFSPAIITSDMTSNLTEFLSFFDGPRSERMRLNSWHLLAPAVLRWALLGLNFDAFFVAQTNSKPVKFLHIFASQNGSQSLRFCQLRWSPVKSKGKRIQLRMKVRFFVRKA